MQLEAQVKGVVQGVGFRWYTQRKAVQLGLRGWVRNEPDGRVRLLAEGPEEALQELLKAVQVGPRSSRVTDVEVEWRDQIEDLGPFQISY